METVRVQSDLVQHLDDLSMKLGALGPAVDAKGFGHDLSDGHVGVEAAERILEDHLQFLAQRFARGRIRRHQIDGFERGAAPEQHLAAVRLQDAQDQPPERRLAAAALADQGQRLATPDIEADAVAGVDRPDLASQDAAAEDREALAQIAHRKNGVLIHPAVPRP